MRSSNYRRRCLGIAAVSNIIIQLVMSHSSIGSLTTLTTVNEDAASTVNEEGDEGKKATGDGGTGRIKWSVELAA